MKRSWKLVPVLLLLVFGAVSSGSAMARGGGGGGHGGGGGGGHGGYSHGGGYGYGWGGLALGIGLASLFWPRYYGGYYPQTYAYPDPAYSYPAPTAAYVEQGVPQAASPPAQAQLQLQPQGDWYFCANSNAYYPYVRECPAGWQRVPSTPPR